MNTEEKAQESEFAAFDHLVQELLSVPGAEIHAKLADAKRHPSHSVPSPGESAERSRTEPD